MSKPRGNPRPKKKTGRPSKLAPDVVARVVEALKGGNYRSVAAQWAGITDTTFRQWMRLGKKKPDSVHGAFRRAVVEAEKEAEIALVRLVMNAAASDPKHAEWLLSHRHPERWADRTRSKVESKTQVTGAGGGPLVVQVVQETAD